MSAARVSISLALFAGAFFCVEGAFFSLCAEDGTELSPRQLYVKRRPVKKPVTPADSAKPDPKPQPAQPNPEPPNATEATNIGLRWSLLNGDSLAEIDTARVFHYKDHIRLKLTANTSGYLYVLNQEPGGQWTPLLPSGETDSNNNKIEMDRPTVVPANQSFEFDEHPGKEKLVVVLSRNREPDLDALIESMKRRQEKPKSSAGSGLMAQNAIPASDFERMRVKLQGRGIRNERIRKSKGGLEDAGYIVASDTDAPRLIAEIDLKHE